MGGNQNDPWQPQGDGGDFCPWWCLHVGLGERLHGNWLEIIMNHDVEGTRGAMGILRAI